MLQPETSRNDVLKNLPVVVQSSSTRDRQVIFEQLASYVDEKTIEESAIRSLCKVVTATVPRYNQRKSRFLVAQFVQRLIFKYPNESSKHLILAILNLVLPMKHSQSTPAVGKTCLFALDLITCVNWPALDQQSKTKFLEIQSILVTVIVGTEKPEQIANTYKKLQSFWRSTSIEEYLDILTEIAKSSDSASALHFVIIWDFAVKYCCENKLVSLLAKHKPVFNDIFIKHIINNKTKVSPKLITWGCKFILKQVDHNEFSTLFLPNLQKALLRNPEVILELTAPIIKGLSLDLSPYANELGKLFATQLYSKEDSQKAEAILVSRCLAEQCSNSSAIEALLKHYFAVLNGSEGKLTVVTQRLGVLSGIGALSFHSANGEQQWLSELAASNFIAVLKQEVHEATLIHVISQLQLWCSRFNNEIPKILIDWFKQMHNSKVSTAPVKSAYFQCLNAALKPSMAEQMDEILPILMNSSQKSLTGTISQLPLLTEGLQAANVVLKLSVWDKQYETKAKSLIQPMLNLEKLLFISEKFINNSTEETLIILLQFIETLVLNFENKLDEKKRIIRALLWIMTSPLSYSIRKNASLACKKLIANSVNPYFCIDFIEEFGTIFKSLTPNQNVGTSEEGALQNQENKNITSSILINCLTNLLSFCDDEMTNSSKLWLATLCSAHIPAIFNVNQCLWVGLFKKFAKNVDMMSFINDNSEIIINFVLREIDEPVKFNALKALVKFEPHNFIPLIFQKLVLTLTRPEFKIVTQRDYEIYLTPEGELYDRSVVETFKNDDEDLKNIKRESKLYSYKEQLAEIELRKEIEAKKKTKSEPELNKKQQEAKSQQLEKEKQIRLRLKKVDEDFSFATNLIDAMLESNPLALSIYIGEIIPLLTNLFDSPLCAKKASQMFIELRKAVFDQKDSELKKFGDSIAYVTLRRLKPQCEIDSAWQVENLNTAVERQLMFLHKRTCRNNSREFDDINTKNQIAKNLLTAPAFAYCLPFLQSLMLSADTKEHRMLQCLQIINEHAQMRRTRDYILKEVVLDEEILKDPAFLPRKYLIEILLKVLTKSTIHVEQTASSVFLEVVSSSNGDINSAIASSEEILTLLAALTSSVDAVRSAILASLKVLAPKVLINIKDSNVKFTLTHRIFVAQFDPFDEHALIAHYLFEECKLQTSESLFPALLSDIINGNSILRHSVAGAMEALLKTYSDRTVDIVEKLLGIYRDKVKLSQPMVDNFGRPIADSQIDTFEPRLGVAIVLRQIASLIPKSHVEQLSKFFVPEALGDRNDNVRNQMLEAGCALVNIHGKDNIGMLLNVFEQFLDEAPNNSDNDAIRRSVVVLLGNLARHIDKDSPKIKPIVAKLIEALSTPSQIVQEAVANCLPYLIPAFKEEAPSLLQKLLQLLFESDNYGERKGAAYGIAGIVKGLGILSLKQFGVMDKLTEAIQQKKKPNHREGALFAFEMLCNMLGRLFEPYIVHILPHLLLCFGDSSTRVRQATDDTAKAVMSKLSAHGVKLVLPSLLNALDEDSWRTKVGSIELLGAMAFCAPKQLSSCLPNIVPKLMIVITDSHPKVQKASAQALKQIGSVIRNPEIQSIVPTLLEALQDPANKTSKCLNTMLNTKFVHFIDAPSLALIMPVVERAFQGRSTETRKMAAQIIGNMYSLTDQKDLAPYLPSIIPGLKQSLLDPVPEVRGVTARALGAMVKGMGEDIFEDLMPWLMNTLTSEASSVDRSGAAQGLSEVLGGLGLERLEKFIPEIISTAERNDIAPHVKDGYIMLFIYLPMVFTQDFTPYIGRIIIPILKALADENEFVRETALKAGQRIVNMYAETAIQLLLPELEIGLFDENWRIRYSSVQLLGDLLFKISGVTGKMTTESNDEDDNFGTEQSHRAIINALGADRRNRVLSGLYMGRSDVSLQVRQAALHVWKVIVTNTPRTLKEILPTLFSLLLGCLASHSCDKQQVAARTLGDLVRKLGERVLPEIIPILEQGLESDRPDQRQGVCIGLSEIMASTSKEMVQAFVDSLVPTVKKALYDPLQEVRQAAAKTFDSLHAAVGIRALDEILPFLLNQLGDAEKGEYTLDGLRQVMAIKSRVVLPYLVPQLTVTPVNTRALSFLSSVAGDSLSKHLPKILPALLVALSTAIDKPNEKQELEYCQSVILSVSDEQGARTIVDHLLETARNDSPSVRRASVMLLNAYCSQSKAAVSSNVSQLLRGLILLSTDSNEQVLNMSWEALNAITKSLDAREQMEHISEIRNAIRFAASDLKSGQQNEKPQLLMPGFCLSKGIAHILPIFREAILNGSPDQKEQAAHGLSEVIELTSAEALKPSVVNIAGPLIRILGDRFTWSVKVAVLDTLSLLLNKVGVLLRPFIPQLQQTFIKALNDAHRNVRLRAANAMSHLIIVHTRCDPVFSDLHNAVKSNNNSDDTSIRETMLHALRLAITPAGDKMSDSVRRQITATITSLLGLSDDSCRTTAAACLGALCAWLPNEELNTVAKEHLLDDDSTLDWTLRHGRSIALRIALKEASNNILKSEWTDKIAKTLTDFITSDRVPITISGVKGTAYLIKEKLANDQLPPQTLLTAFARGMNHSSNEVKQTVAISTIFIAKSVTSIRQPQLFKTIVPLLVNGTKEKNTVVKVNSEHALIAFLKLRTTDEVLQNCITALDPGAKEALQDCVNKVLKKVASQPEPREEEFDDTLLI